MARNQTDKDAAADKTDAPPPPTTEPAPLTPEALAAGQAAAAAAASAATMGTGLAPSAAAMGAAAAAGEVAADMFVDRRRPVPGLVYDRSRRRGVPYTPGMAAPAGPRFRVHHADPEFAGLKAGVQFIGGVGETDDAEVAQLFGRLKCRVVEAEPTR